GTDARMLIAPHEPTLDHVSHIVEWSKNAGYATARLDEPTQQDADVIVIDRVGVLGDLYALADIAFVGGAFHAAGLHSVLEPAAFGAPVVFGPRYANSREAGLLIAAGAAASVSDSPALEVVLGHWLEER